MALNFEESFSRLNVKGKQGGIETRTAIQESTLDSLKCITGENMALITQVRWLRLIWSSILLISFNARKLNGEIDNEDT